MIARTANKRLATQRSTVFRFRGCLLADNVNRRPSTRPATTIASPLNARDSELIPFFDYPHPYHPGSTSSTGLFLHDRLRSPTSINLLARGTLVRAQSLTDRILRARESRDELRLVLKNLDKLSDILCGVIDLAELIRNSHPDPAWVASANEAYDTLCEFMNVLNTHVGLYEVRVRSLMKFSSSSYHFRS